MSVGFPVLLFKQEQGITICYRLCSGVFRVKYKPGVETDRLGPKGYRGGCGGKCMGLAWEKYDCGRIFDRLKLIIETEAAYNYPLSIG